MRMLHYWTGLAATALLALLVAAALGIFGAAPDAHLVAGLFAAASTVGAHALLIVFMLVSGRIVREAMRTRPLPAELLDEHNRFFAHKRAYPAAGLGAVAIVATGVLGYARHGFGWSPAVHMLAGVVAVLYNAWAFQQEWRALRENQQLLDRTASSLDAIDRAHPEIAAAAAEARARESFAPAKSWLIVGISAWMPYLYWALVVWRGDFSRMAGWMLPATIAVSVLALLCAWLTRGVRTALE
ncbi:MAG: hypothetical protein EPO68_13645 [Planctomycetota bacterium]|nr:MAG: hypothetical protein EPO68_13645 [Planctomycetota bacterium]